MVQVKQLQNKELLLEHARSSYNLTFFGRNEIYLALILLIVGIIFIFNFDSIMFIGYALIFVGLFETIKIPFRYERFAKLKAKEKIFGKELVFRINESKLGIKVGEDEVTYNYNEMKACIISNTGILFKINLKRYFYISFKSFKNKNELDSILSILKDVFK